MHVPLVEMTTVSPQDYVQWLSVNEETLFLHDGLIRVTDLVELPHDVNATEQLDHEVINFDSKSLTELSEKLKNVCGIQNNANARLLEYRLNALRGYWRALHQLAIEEQTERNIVQESQSKKSLQWKYTESVSFSTQVGLLLVLPLLQSQSRFDSALCGVTANLLLKCLRDCPPLSLTKEPNDCLNGLETLLSDWLIESQNVEKPLLDPTQHQNAAAALVALACAR